jgi:heat-inducible transcriptional repressor
MKMLTPKKPAKQDREKLILFALVELYLKTGKPIGSNTLKDSGFKTLSSATIRNCFSKLEEDGYLKQQHSSGGRVPTPLAYKLYAEAHIKNPILGEAEKKWIKKHLFRETREIASYLQRAAEALSEMTGCAVFLSAPRFDQDFLLDVKLLSIDQNRVLCVLITDFGIIHTETLHTEKKLSTFVLKRLEAYFNSKLTGQEKPKLDPEEEVLAEGLYKEIMLRHIVSYTNFSAEDLFQAGFSKFLSFPDFSSALASGLSLFENKSELRNLLNQCMKKGETTCLIGEGLDPYSSETSTCSAILVPYRIHQTFCGAFGILGPNRISYRELFGILQAASEAISESLTRSMYKFKITFRQPQAGHTSFIPEKPAPELLIENKIGDDTHG